MKALIKSFHNQVSLLDLEQVTDLTVVSKSVVAALRKPDSTVTMINITIEVEGTDVAQPATWRVLNASLVLARSPWLRLPATTGQTDAESIRLATKGGDGSKDVTVTIVLSASGLRERAAPYTERLPIEVRSDFDAATRMRLLDITLTVQALTSFAVWGRALAGQEQCAPSAQTMIEVSTTV
eukprot:5507715-Prymnesium_polylepis.1